jgi:(1->4)-alpha-D-glucan 1-alpha-D-glucosylmutase
VPDIYQGCEFWDFSLVDPDNRRPVDFEKRKRMLSELKERSAAGLGALARELAGNPLDCRIKMFLVRAMLGLRKERPALFEKGSYRPVEASGKFGRNLVAFVREYGGSTLLVIAPRFFTHFLKEGQPLAAPEVWADTTLTLPESAPLNYKSVITDREVRLDSRQVPVGSLLKDFPVEAYLNLAG